MSSAAKLAVCFVAVDDCLFHFVMCVIAGIPLVVVIIVIAVNKDNYGLISYGKFSDGTTDEL